MALLSGDRGIDGASGSRATYNLDRAGNRTSIVDGGVTRTYTRDVTNEYTAAEGSAVTNNSEHQISAYLGVSFGYVNDGQLSSVSAGSDNCTFGYDALGRRVKRLLNGDVRYYIYDGEKALLDLDGNGDVNGWNVYGKGVDELLERGTTGLDGSWHWCFVQSDHEGSVTHLTDAAGAVLEKYKYDAFGKPVIMNAAGAVLSGGTAYGNRFLFTGREYLANFGIYEYRARAYHPKLGRFTSEDPTLFDGGDYNLFRYCHNDPVDMTDPMGLFDVGYEGYGTFTLQSGATRDTFGNVELRRYIASQHGQIFDRTQKGQQQALAAIRTALANNPKEPINIFGYSRGAKAANDTAVAAGKEGIRVNHEVLIDPVKIDLTRIPPGQPLSLKIPENVDRADNYYQHSGGPFQGGPAANPSNRVVNHDLSEEGVNHNNIVQRALNYELRYRTDSHIPDRVPVITEKDH